MEASSSYRELEVITLYIFFVLSLCPSCLCGELFFFTTKDTKGTKVAQLETF